MIGTSNHYDLGTVGKLATRATTFIYTLWGRSLKDFEKKIILWHTYDFLRPFFDKDR